MMPTAYVETFIQANSTTGNDVLFAQRYLSNGTKSGSPIQVTSSDISVDFVNSLTLLSDGGFVVDYYDRDADGFINNALTQVTKNNFPADVISTPYYEQPSYSITALDAGAFAYLSYVTIGNDLPSLSINLGYSNADGGGFVSSLVTLPYGGNPYPTLILDYVSLKALANSTFSVSYSVSYTQGDPDYPTPEPSGHQVSTQIYRDDGTLQSSTLNNFDGSTTISRYDSAARLTSTFVHSADGTNDFTNFNPATGNETDEYIRYADGSRTIVNLAVTGEAYTQQTASYDATGKLVSQTRKYASGVTALTLTTDSAGVQSVANYDTLGRITTSSTISVDGSREVVVSKYSGTSTTPTLIEDDHFGSSQKILSSDISAPNGPHMQTAYAAGVTLTSHAGIGDTFKGSVAGGNAFVFNAGFGQDLVTNFRSGTSHNTITFDSAVAADFQHLQPKISATSAGALITISPTDSLLLKGVSAASLTSADFTFKPHAGA